MVEALKAELRVMVATERRALRHLSRSYATISRELTALQGRSSAGAVIERAQLRAIQAFLTNELASMWRNVGNEVRAGRIEAARTAGEPSAEALEYFRAAGLSPKDIEALRRASKLAAENTVSAAMKRVNGDTYIPLSDRVYHTGVLTNGRLNDIINVAMTKGMDAAALAKSVRQFIRPDTAGGVRYAAQRLARTEINNAFHAVTIERMQSEPFVESAQWHLSGTHRVPDECNKYAEHTEKPGDEPGTWSKGSVPARPHPQCLCYVTAVDIGREEFIQAFNSGKYNDWLKDEIGYEAETSTPVGLPRLSMWDDSKLSKLEKIAAGADENRDGRDAVLEAIAKENGFDAKPVLVSSLPGQNPTLYRGLPNARYAEAYKHGEYFGGTGIHGNGSYWTENKTRAEKYTDPALRYGTSNENGVLLRGEMLEDANVVSTDDMWALLDGDQLPARVAALADEDPGKLAALLGYDAIRNRQLVVVLNRGAQYVEDSIAGRAVKR